MATLGRLAVIPQGANTRVVLAQVTREAIATTANVRVVLTNIKT